MSNILDLIAKVSWDTNEDELKKTTDLLKSEDKLLDELRLKGRRLEEQMVKTNDPKKVSAYNKELQEVAKTANRITESQEKQKKITDELRKKQKELHDELRKGGDATVVQGLLRNLHKVENQLDVLTSKSTSVGSKIGGLGESILQGFGIGAGMFGIEQAITKISELGDIAIQEAQDAERITGELQRALKSVGKEKYFDGLIEEANTLQKKFYGLFDNDEIVQAQTALVNYGKLTRAELSQLTPVILELASAEKIDLATATEKIIAILEGRGGATLREYGLSVKGVKSEHDRLNLVLNEFNNKLIGSAETYANTAEGIERANKVMVANIEESIGNSLLSLKRKILPAVKSILDYINYQISDSNEKLKIVGGNLVKQTGSDAEQFAKMYVDKVDKAIKEGKVKEEDRYKAIVRYYNNAEKQYVDSYNRIREQHLKLYDASKNTDNIDVKRLNDEMAMAKYNLEKIRSLRAEFISGNAVDKTLINPNAAFYEEPEAKGKIEKTKKLIEKESKKNPINLTVDFSNDNLDKLADEIKKNLLEKLKQAELYGKTYLQTIDNNVLQKGNETTDSQAKEIRDSIELARKKAKELIDEQELKDKRKQSINEQIDSINSLIGAYSMLAGAINEAYSLEIKKIDQLISKQEQRVEDSKKNATASLKIEQDRLDELQRKREKYERAQRVIDASVVVANQAVAISGAVASIASQKNPVLIGAQVLAIIAGIAASVNAVRSVSVGYEDGGYTGDGAKSQESTQLGRKPYTYHKGEFVMDAALTADNRDLFEGMHKRDLIARQIADGYYMVAPKSIDTDKVVADHYTIKNSTNLEPLIYEMQSMKKLLSQREVIVSNNFDADGFGQSIATSLGKVNILNKQRG